MDLWSIRTEALRRRLVKARRLWVFAYGSLLWNPGFPVAEQRPALARGLQRRFCIRSVHYRGTPERPGLVLGLDRGGVCAGLVLRPPPGAVADTVAYLWARELITPVYEPALVRLATCSGPVQALAFIVRRRSPDFFDDPDMTMAADHIHEARGSNGTNLDYLAATVDKLRRLKLPDARLEALLTEVRRRSGD